MPAHELKRAQARTEAALLAKFQKVINGRGDKASITIARKTWKKEGHTANEIDAMAGNLERALLDVK